MRFDILTLFPALFTSVFQESIVKRAIEAGTVTINIHNIRDYATDKHHVTDDTPYGGGGGMVMKVEPIVLAVEHILGADLVARQKATGQVEVPVILLTPAGRLFNQHMPAGEEAVMGDGMVRSGIGHDHHARDLWHGRCHRAQIVPYARAAAQQRDGFVSQLFGVGGRAAIHRYQIDHVEIGRSQCMETAQIAPCHAASADYRQRNVHYADRFR